jgi:hypothetical protein
MPASSAAFSFEQLARELEAAGTARSVIRRTVQELQDHCEDAQAAALERGLSADAARTEALECLGSVEAIVAEAASRASLLDWRHRWPTSARYVDSIAYCCALPAAPFVYCATHPAGIVRWSLSSGIATCITAAMLLVLQSLFS